jgi:hypothetical protein
MRKGNWMICPACHGNGTHVNPNIDAGGITASEMHDDPEFLEQYMSGVYDQPCDVCSGSGKIREGKLEELAQNAEDRKLAAMEDGDYEGYLMAGDYRYG